jgi:hypothetical protein
MPLALLSATAPLKAKILIPAEPILSVSLDVADTIEFKVSERVTALWDKRS